MVDVVAGDTAVVGDEANMVVLGADVVEGGVVKCSVLKKRCVEMFDVGKVLMCGDMM